MLPREMIYFVCIDREIELVYKHDDGITRVPITEAALLKLVAQGSNILYNQLRFFDVPPSMPRP